jgi:hypothetical protein
MEPQVGLIPGSKLLPMVTLDIPGFGENLVERKLLVALNSCKFDSAAQKRSTTPGDFFFVGS